MADSSYIDNNIAAGEERQAQITAEVIRFATNRAVIERAKGMLMLIYGIDEPAAFELLKSHSQDANVKLRWLAEQVVDDFLAHSDSEMLSRRAAFDALLLTAHERVVATRQSLRSI
jgi:hypothetical protein